MKFFFRKAPSEKPVDHFVRLYGDLIYDLCESVLWSSSLAQTAFRSILKELKKQPASGRFTQNERTWVLSVAYRRLKELCDRHGRSLTPSEQIQLDASQNVSLRLKQFDSFFHRLTDDDQILLLLRDKYGLPYWEIASALGVPEDSLKTRRQLALRTLEDWLWDNP